MGVRVTAVPCLTSLRWLAGRPDRVCRVPTPAVGGKTALPQGRRRGMTTHHGLLQPSCRTIGPPADVVLWRRCRLLEAGFPDPLATRLANAAVDVHALLQLVDRGCPPVLAARILAPAGFRLDPVGSRTGAPA